MIYSFKIAALYHDIGFLSGYSNHEEKGCLNCQKRHEGIWFDRKTVGK